MSSASQATLRDAPRLGDFIALVRKRWVFVVLFLLLGLAASVGDIVTATKQYQATVQIFVAASAPTSSSNDALNAGNLFAEARVQSYITVATSPTVTQVVRQGLGLALTDRQLAQRITADAPLNKVLVNIHVSDRSPVQASRIANAVADQFIIEVQKVEAVRTTPTSEPISPVSLTVIHPAVPPSSPISPKKKLILLAGLLGGLVLGLGLIVGWDRFDTRLRTTKEVEQLIDRSVLAEIPQDKNAGRLPLAVRDDGSGARSEAFRRLRANLQFVGVDKPPRVIAVTSGLPAEGKTSVSMNLALCMAEAGLKVCLVETDLRRPTIAKTLGLQSEAGLTSVLVGKASLEDVLQEAGQGLTVLCSGALPPNPSELLASLQFESTVAEIAKLYDYVILDTAPLLPVADGVEVVSIAEATLLVVRAGVTKREVLLSAVGTLTRVACPMAGIVLNGASKSTSDGYDSYRPVDADRAAKSK